MTDPSDRIRDVASLALEMERGWDPKYLLFWGHTPAKGKTVGPFVLSQWYPAAFSVDGLRYATAEHFMMAEKARLFGDEETRNRVIATSHPGAAKALGREVRGFDDAAWTGARFDIVVRGSVAKFGQNETLRTYLVETGSKVLVEASPVDTVWGTGLARDHVDASTVSKWRGLNLLGFALMQARRELRGGSV